MWIRMRLERNQIVRLLGVVTLLITLVTSVVVMVENARLTDCMRRNIQANYQRNKFTDDLRALQDRDQANIDRLIITVTEATDRQVFRQALTDYVDEARKVDEERDEARRKQDRYKYPPLDDCD